MLESPVGHLISLASSPCVMHNTCHSDTATVWFDVVDSQSGASVKTLINSLIQFGPASCLICSACANPSTPSVSIAGGGATWLACAQHVLPTVLSALVLTLGTTTTLIVVAARAIRKQSPDWYPPLQMDSFVCTSVAV
jgi:hypothetical protein